MTNALPPLTKDLIDAFAASAVAWAVRLLSVLFAPSAARRQRLLRRFVNHLECCVEAIIFLKAVRRFGPPPQRRPRRQPTGGEAGNASGIKWLRHCGLECRLGISFPI